MSCRLGRRTHLRLRHLRMSPPRMRRSLRLPRRRPQLPEPASRALRISSRPPSRSQRACRSPRSPSRRTARSLRAAFPPKARLSNSLRTRTRIGSRSRRIRPSGAAFGRPLRMPAAGLSIPGVRPRVLSALRVSGSRARAEGSRRRRASRHLLRLARHP